MSYEKYYNDELVKNIFVLSKDQSYKNSKKFKYQFLILYYFFQNDTWTDIREGTYRINITSLDDQFPAMNVTI